MGLERGIGGKREERELGGKIFHFPWESSSGRGKEAEIRIRTEVFDVVLGFVFETVTNKAS